MNRIRFGMVGGGSGAFIGAVHRHAARLDGHFDLVCGAFSSQPASSLSSGQALGLPAARCYPDYNTMCVAEASLPPELRMQCVVIVSPNHQHFGPAVTALNHGFHVLSDKPATFTLSEAKELQELLSKTACLYGLTHTYTGYPMVQEARARVANGELGTIRKIIVQYTQGWLSDPVEHDNNPQAAWRLDPARAGISCCMADIGVHAFNLAEFVSAAQTTQLCAELNSIVPGRQLDDDGTVLMHFANGARGTLIASQICNGDENDLILRIYGDRGSLQWQQMEPNSLWLRANNQATQQLRSATSVTSAGSRAHTRLPPGHPEGYLEAFANLYSDFAHNIHAHTAGEPLPFTIPGIAEAVRGMAFIETVVRSSAAGCQWLPLKT